MLVRRRLFTPLWLPGHTRPQYRVRWVGYSEDDDTWEPEAHILNPFLLEGFQRCARLSEAFQGSDRGCRSEFEQISRLRRRALIARESRINW